MIRLLGMCIDGYNQIPQTFPGGELAKYHTQHLVPTGEMSDVLIAFILGHQSVECSPGKKIRQLRKNVFALVHRVNALTPNIQIQIVTRTKYAVTFGIQGFQRTFVFI